MLQASAPTATAADGVNFSAATQAAAFQQQQRQHMLFGLSRLQQLQQLSPQQQQQLQQLLQQQQQHSALQHQAQQPVPAAEPATPCFSSLAEALGGALLPPPTTGTDGHGVPQEPSSAVAASSVETQLPATMLHVSASAAASCSAAATFGGFSAQQSLFSIIRLGSA